MKKIRPWMLVYLLIFLPLTYASIKNDIDHQYPAVYIAVGSLAFLAFNIGIVLYSSNIQNDAIKLIWKYLFPYMIAYLFTSSIIDAFWGRRFNLSVEGIIREILVIALLIVIFFPAIRASYFLAYRKIKTTVQL